jgi:uncharacterized protein YcbK (DUF882 family)
MTKNFKLEEFACKSGAPMPLSVRTNVERLAKNLQVLRDELKVPMTITSGHRSAEHNKKIGGATFSRHLMGDAADFKAHGIAPSAVAAIIERLISEGKMEQGGLKAYATWTHYDCSLKKRRW